MYRLFFITSCFALTTGWALGPMSHLVCSTKSTAESPSEQRNIAELVLGPPKVIDACYDNDRVMITLFFRQTKERGLKIYSGTSAIRIDGKEHAIIHSDSFMTESQTGHKNVIVEYWFDIPDALQGKQIESATISYKFNEDDPDIAVTEFRQVDVELNGS